MNVTVKDIKLLKAIHPQQVATYLQAKGWQQKQQIANQAIIWMKDNEFQGQFNLVLPLNPDVPDFPISMNLMLETLSKSEDRSQLDILNDLIIQLSNLTIAVDTPIRINTLSGDVPTERLYKSMVS